MRKIGLHKVTLGRVELPRVAFSDRKGGEPKPPWWDVANILTEDGGFMLTEDGGAILMENEVKQIRLRPQEGGISR